MNKLQMIFALLAVLQVSFGGKLANDPFIVGGIPAEIEDYPHKLAIIDLVRGGYLCGASNIHPLWALTAAHCLDLGTPAELLNLYGGSTSRLTGGHIFFVESYHIHPQYNPSTWDVDVGLIEVYSGSPLVGFPNVLPIAISPICSTDCCEVCPEGPAVTVVGWGVMEGNILPEHLRQVDKDIMSLELCNEYWHFHPGGITDAKFCTIIEDGRDSCNGDSGSAVIRNGVQVGIVNFGSAVCGDGSVPAVYARLEQPDVRNWIDSYVSV